MIRATSKLGRSIMPINGNVISVIAKNHTTTVQTKVSEWKGNTYIDIREYFKNQAGEWIPTKKGIAITTSMLSEVITAMEKAEELLCNAPAAEKS